MDISDKSCEKMIIDYMRVKQGVTYCIARWMYLCKLWLVSFRLVPQAKRDKVKYKVIFDRAYSVSPDVIPASNASEYLHNEACHGL